MKLISTVLIGAMTSTTVGVSTAGCTPVQQAAFTQIDNIVLADLKAGKTLPQIEDDVAAIVLPGNASADIVTIVNAAIAMLLNLTGVVPANIVPLATAMQSELAMKHVAGAKR